MNLPNENTKKKYFNENFEDSMNKNKRKSKNNMMCLGPCIEPGRSIMHPVYLTYVTDKTKPFCATNQWFNNGERMIIDECELPKSKKKESVAIKEINYLIPTFYFNCQDFLKNYYNINNYDQGIEYIYNSIKKEENISTPKTLLRIMECIWKSYGNDLKILNNKLVEIYLWLSKKIWINEIYKSLSNELEIKNNTLSDREIKKRKINYIYEKIISKQFIYDILKKHIEKNRIPSERWDAIKSHNDMIEENIIKNAINIF